MTTTVQHIEVGSEPIPGYKVLRKLGVGGYGEVWSAEAPGGMEKAVKFVFGSHDSERGARELRSLNRIKGVNHPFLLSLERFEIINSQLIIVTELASGSLEDVFTKHRERGSCGVPKQELIGYLNDAADGLDYLHEEFQLQHLDVKPGNLLLVGGHVKVGDFGLLKDLGDVECSMVGGLTPIYAAPEVFDGKPHQNSDQYSLAVMYQELLTGHRPFAGRTIAQLATQHIHSAPNLDALPAADRPVIARALEKDPSRRFSNCREFINRLGRSNEQPTNVPTRSRIAGGKSHSLTQTGNFTPEEIRAEISNLPSVSSETSERSGVQQAVVIGLGGTGQAVMRDLCLRQANAGDEDIDLRGLLIDTDDASIYGFREFEFENNLICNVERACFPLKSPHDYREQTTERLSTVSRRWIYNVPKTRRTEGLRPLGRLALVDHSDHLESLLSQAISGLQASAELAPRVYVVSSLTGGTGSGMFMDVIFKLRHLMDDNGLAESTIRPLLIGSTTPGDTEARSLALAATHAALSEIRYFLLPDKSYPEDKANKFHAVPAARTPLPNTYVIAPDSIEEGVSHVAQYLWTDAFVAPEMIDLARKTPDDSGNRTQTTVKSFGIAPLNIHPSTDVRKLKEQAVDGLIRQWVGNPKIKNEDVDKKAIETLDVIGASPNLWAQSQLTALIGQNIDGWKQGLAKNIEDDVKSNRDEYLAAKAAVIAGRARVQPLLVQASKAQESEEYIPQAATATTQKLKELLDKELVDGGTTLFEVVELLREISKQCFQFARENESEIKRQKTEAENKLHQFVNDLSVTSFEDVQLNEITDSLVEILKADLRSPNGILFEDIANQCKLLEAKYMVRARELAAVHSALSKTMENSSIRPDAVYQQVFPIALERTHAKFASVLVTQGKAFDNVDAFLESIRDEISCTVDSVLNDTSGNGVLTTSELSVHIASALRKAHPRLLQFGGGQRLMLVGGDKIQLAALKPAIEEVVGCEISIAESPGAETVLVHEASEIPVESILANLMGSLSSDLTIANRLMSRCDIQWGGASDRNSSSITTK